MGNTVDLQYYSSGGATYLAADAIDMLGGKQFDCIMIASRRARELQRGATPLISDTKGHQFPVIALKEIAAGLIGIEYLTKPYEKEAPLRQVSKRSHRPRERRGVDE